MIELEKLRKYSSDVVEAIRAVHKELGPGLNEAIYHEGLNIELTERNIPFEKEFCFHPSYHGIKLDASFTMDFLVKSDIIVEIESAKEKLNDEHRKILFNHMRFFQPQVGILVNFYPDFAEIEQYFFSKEKQRLYGSDRLQIKNFYM